MSRSLTPDQKKQVLTTPQFLSNKSQEEVILAHFLLHFKSLRNTKLTHLIRMELTLVMLALNGNLACRAFIIWATTRGFIIQWNPDLSNFLGKRKLVGKIEGGTKSRLIYEVLFYNNRERDRYTMALF